MNIPLTNVPLKRIASILPALEERGTVYLFAFAERMEAEEWDVILSSEWSNEDWAGTIRIVVDLLWPLLSSKERAMIGQIAVVPANELGVQTLTDALDGVTPKDEKVILTSFLGSDVRRAFVFKAQRAPVPLPTAPEMAAANG